VVGFGVIEVRVRVRLGLEALVRILVVPVGVVVRVLVILVGSHRTIVFEGPALFERRRLRVVEGLLLGIRGRGRRRRPRCARGADRPGATRGRPAFTGFVRRQPATGDRLRIVVARIGRRHEPAHIDQVAGAISPVPRIHGEQDDVGHGSDDHEEKQRGRWQVHGRKPP
jgi:hypothetical protein